jgi:hypothetical protein
MRRAVLPTLLSAAVLSFVAPSGFYEAHALERVASFIAGKPATIYCARTTAGWSAYTVPIYGDVNINGTTYPGSSETLLAPPVCANLAAPRRTAPYLLAASILTLTHEAIHQRGEADEGRTECAAMHEMPRVAVKFFGVAPGKMLRALMADAWRYHRLKAPAFRAVC